MGANVSDSTVSEQHIDMLRDQITQMESRMIDPREFGRLEQQVQQLSAQVVAMQTTLQAINATLNEAKGGWRALMLMGGASAAAGGIVTWLLQHVKVFP